ncbi:calcineurin-binding protein 1 isoform X2 [Mercurialis annua]|uniref:calcineurin-binding protein 1 isoform X2 n=1 Tax=Mercurialis annua TaxID=3986 RepID=UPI00215F0DF3|nr:calcineurin-binding protein 1 isoform X2 [Mercurialis annua]
MYSFAAINDTDSREQWEPLAPTKEAQEFHLTQSYHDGLLKLQAKSYDKARELLESVLKDPLISNPQVESNAGDDHLQQLRFLALKNLATVFLEQGSAHYESALTCYLQAVEIDSKDSVVWNQLGTLSCSMGMLSISRWAFEQGLLCSPNNWNCMEKLLEVLIAIGDEVACLSVAELILRHWPSHSRASCVKSTIQDYEPVPFAPRGIDKLEPKHVRLKFLDKRKATDENKNEAIACKKLNRCIELYLPEASWAALADALLEILLPLNGCGSKKGAEKEFRSGDIRLTIHLHSFMNNIVGSTLDRGQNPMSGESLSVGACNSEKANLFKDKEAITLEEQPHERRSTRLERLRSRKPGKEELDFAASKDLAKAVLQLLEPFVVGELINTDSDKLAGHSVSCSSRANSMDTEHKDVSAFLRETSKNYGAYHMGHLLLEHAATIGLAYQDVFVKLLELEKLTRNWGQDRSQGCNLFLAELYYELGSLPSNASKLPEFMSEASYQLCKIIESVALDYPFSLNQILGNESCSLLNSSQDNNEIFAKDSSCQESSFSSSLVTDKIPFWIRYFWLSGKLSIFDCNKAKAHEEFCICLSLLLKMDEMNDSLRSVHLPYLKTNEDLTVNCVLHEINLLKIDFLLEKTLGEMIDKEMYVECINLLAPLLFSTEHSHIDVLPAPSSDEKGEEYASTELTAINLLLKACEKAKPINIEVYLNCQRRKLQLLMLAAGMDEYQTLRLRYGLKELSASDVMSKENPGSHWNDLVAKEVKAISQSVSQLKMDPSLDSNGVVIPIASIGNIQTLLLAFMCHVAINFLSKQSSAIAMGDETEQKQGFSFVDAGIAFCKLQHIIPTVTVKTQVELVMAIHDLLAEYGLCCAGEGGKGEEGTFLKFAIKHLLALDMKLKSNLNSSSCETGNKQLSPHSQGKTCGQESKSDTVDVEMGGNEITVVTDVETDVSEGIASKGMSSVEGLENDGEVVGFEKQGGDEDKIMGEITTEQFPELGTELTEDEREELELIIDNALDQCFFCLYGLNLRPDSSFEDDLAMHRNTSRGDYQTKEQCADVFHYILPYAKASSKTGLVKLRRVLRAIRKHFPQPPEDVLTGNAIDKFLDDPELYEDKLSEEAGSEGFLETIMKKIFSDVGSVKQHKSMMIRSSEPYFDVYCNLYYFLALSEEMSTTDKWPGFVLTKEGEEFVQQNANLFKYDLLYNPLRFESWQRLANIYDEEVDLLLNDGSKHINVAGWRKNTTLPQRVETSRRRSRRCLLVSLALAKTSAQQCEIHELLALVYYDGLQNVVPFYDQRSAVPVKDATWMAYCENSLKHFKKASLHKQDWSHAFYMGKLCEKLGYSYDTSLSHYDNAIALNPSAVDPIYRMHASRLKLLCMCGKQNLEALKVLSGFSFSVSIKDSSMTILGKLAPERSNSPDDMDRSAQEISEEKKREELNCMEDVWNMLYNDCLSALEICVEGDLKHFHKARYMLAQGLYRRRLHGDLERAKEELSFCFKSSRSSFTINMWEIDSMAKKGRRKTSGIAGNKKALEVNLPESSRKFITCIRKYILFYLKLLEETGDICTLDRAFNSLRADKRFSLCIEDIVPVALGRLIKALVLSMHQTGSSGPSSSEHQLERLFSLFMEQGNLWPEIFHLPEIRSPEISEGSLYGFLHTYIASLESNGKLETIEVINEKIRKRFKNPKLSNSNCAKVCRHASVSWCRSLIISLASITPLQRGNSIESQAHNPSDGVLESGPRLCVDLQTNELWSLSVEDSISLENLETKWNPVLTKIKNVIVEKASDENFEAANSLIKSSYNFFRESSCLMLPSGLYLYLAPTQLLMGTELRAGLNGVEILDLSIPRKLLLWAYTLLHGLYANIAIVLKHCEENVKPKMKKGAGSSYSPLNTSLPTATAIHIGGAKDGASHVGGNEQETTSVTPGPSCDAQCLNPSLPSNENKKELI